MKIISSLAIGLVLGAALSYMPHAKANSATLTHILITPVGITDFKSITADVAGTPVVGVSCVPKPMPKAPDAAICYVTTTTSN
jgi:hypothetical protein